MQTSRQLEYVWMASLSLSVLGLQFTVQRPDIGHPWTEGFWWMGLLLTVALLSYGGLMRLPFELGRHRRLLWLGMGLRLALVAHLPPLSDDFYRYVWDGRLAMAGANPYAFTPQEWLDLRQGIDPAAWTDIFPHLNSKGFYTVYPSFMQAVFAGCAWLAGGSLWGTVTLLKGLIVVAEGISVWLLVRLLRQWGLPLGNSWLYALNPLVILELSGNAHTEAFMVVLVLAMLLALSNGKAWQAGAFLAAGAAAKLLPVLAVPFLLRRLKPRWTAVILGMGALTALALLQWHVRWENLPHFLESLRLYFQYFQFNAALHYWTQDIAGGGAQQVLARVLPWVMLALILVRAWTERKLDWAGMATSLLVALTLYQLHSPVIHPWYITPLLALAALTRFRYPYLWGALIPFTYCAYFYPGIQEQRWLVTVEYVLLFGYMGYEWVFKRSDLNLGEWVARSPRLSALMRRSIPARLRIKQARIARHLQAGTRILDIGAGHGGLALALRREGHDITSVDVQNLSLFPEIQPIIYDGKRLPFADQSFDTCLLITMLHHTPVPEEILREARRVTRRRLVVMEDIYSNVLQRELTYFTDSLVNLEFAHHPHTNKTDAGWRATFAEMGLQVVAHEEFRTLVFFRQVIYVLEPVSVG